MGLLVSGRSIDGEADLLERLEDEPDVSIIASRFLEEPRCLQPTSKAIVVMQGECASIDLAAEQPLLASAQATTCIIVALLDRSSGRAAMAHLDANTARQTGNLPALLADMAAPELYLVGGYCDAKGLGPRTCSILLAAFRAAPQPVSLRLMCAGQLNTSADGAPRAQSLAVDTSTGAAFPLAALPAPDAVPQLSARLAQLWLRPDTSALRPVYDAACRRLRLRLAEGGLPPGAAESMADLLRLDDQTLLEACSTSPEHECPEFITGVRAALRWMLQQAGKPPRLADSWYGWQHGTGWQPAPQAQEGAPAGRLPLTR